MRGGRGGEKRGIPHLIVVIGFGLCVLLAFDFNADELLGAQWLEALSGELFPEET